MLIEHEMFESRSSFYNLEPKGIGTDQVESLTSYISRLSETHNIKTSRLFLFMGEHVLLTFNKHIPVSSRSRSFNGSGKYNSQVTNALSELTRRKDINMLSLYDFSKYISGREMRKYRAWCPTCLKSDEINSTGVYDRLIWNIDSIKICHKHKCLLETRCPKCDNENPVLSPNATIDNCHYCESKLSDSFPRYIQDFEEMEFQELVIKQVSLLLSLAKVERDLLFKSTLEIHEVIKEIVRCVGGMFGLSKRKFAINYLRIVRTHLDYWTAGKHKPTLLNLARLSYVTDRNIIDLLSLNIDLENIHPFPEKFDKYMVFLMHSTYSQEEIKEKLNEIIKEDSYKKYNLNKLAKILGYSNGSILRDYYPEEHKIISKRRNEYLKEKRRQKEINTEKTFEKII